jgi:L,D-transpeptidase ErfK/SrfK
MRRFNVIAQDRVTAGVAHWTRALLVLAVVVAVFRSGPAHATVFELPADGSIVIGTDATITTHYKDTLLEIARQYSLGYDEIIRANPGVDMWIPGEGTQISLPGRHR